MKLPTWLEAVLFIVALLLGWSWLRSHDALRDAVAQKDALQHEIGDLQKGIDSAGKAERSANDALDKERKKKATVQTVTKYLPIPLPGKIDIQPVNGTPTLTVSGDPQANLQAIQDAEIKCLQCRNSLDSRNQQYADLQKQLDLERLNSKNFEKAAKRGTGFWARTKEWTIRAGFAAGGYAAGRAIK